MRPSRITPTMRTGSCTAKAQDLVVEAGLADLVEIDGVVLAQQVELLRGDLARDADREARARERMAVHQIGRQAEVPDLVLEQLRNGSTNIMFMRAGRPPICRGS
jgi:hypothetical protein